MDISQMIDLELAELAANLADLLAGNELSAIDTHVRADLVTAFGTQPADFKNEIAAQLIANDERQAATSAKDARRQALEFLIRRTQFALKAGAADKKQFDLARLNFPAQRANAYIAQTPSDMAAYGFSNAINKGRFKGNNRGASIMYEIWRREGDEGPWLLHILTSKQRFTDEGVTPGQYYEYRVRARAKQNVSPFSNSSVVYGVL